MLRGGEGAVKLLVCVGAGTVFLLILVHGGTEFLFELVGAEESGEQLLRRRVELSASTPYSTEAMPDSMGSKQAGLPPCFHINAVWHGCIDGGQSGESDASIAGQAVQKRYPSKLTAYEKPPW